jgi:hypothetical protein
MDGRRVMNKANGDVYNDYLSNGLAHGSGVLDMQTEKFMLEHGLRE